MTWNLANLSPEERAAEDQRRRDALLRHQNAGKFATVADREYHRILMGRLTHQKLWVGWARRHRV